METTTCISPKADSRVVWLDVVRLIAMFTVVCCHCTDPFNFYPGTAPNIEDIKFWGAIYGAVLRPCVPLFVMITGALLLPVRGDTSAFYKKRIARVLYPFFIWSVIYNLFPWITGWLGFSPQIILDFFPYAGEEVMRQSFSVAVKYILNIPFNFSILAVHMWYIYLLIGLYLYLPVFSAWVEKASERAKLMFLLAWGVTLLLPYYYQFVSNYLWGTCSWNSFGMLYAFAGFNGTPIVGTYRDTPFDAKEFTVTIYLEEQSVEEAKLTLDNWNFFITCNAQQGKRMEIHLINGKATDLFDTSLVGGVVFSPSTPFRAKGNFCWAMQIPGEFRFPLENNNIRQSFENFDSWITKPEYDWYNHFIPEKVK